MYRVPRCAYLTDYEGVAFGDVLATVVWLGRYKEHPNLCLQSNVRSSEIIFR